MALISKLTSIADEIRGKSTLTDKTSLEQMVLDIAMLTPLTIGEVPSYVQEEAERVAGLVKALQNDNTLTTIHSTDVHVGSDAQSRASALHLAQAIHIIKKLVSVDGTFSHGDIVTGSASDSLETHMDNLMCARRTLSIADSDAEMGGNHDANIYNADCFMTPSELYKYIGRRNVKVVKPTTETERNYFCIDIKNTRFICLNTADLKDISASSPQDGHHISKYQFEWLISVLGSCVSDGIENILVLSHHPLHWYGSMPNVLTILDAYINGTSGSITTDSESVSFDFSSTNGAKILGTVHGHTHNLIHGKVGDNEIIRLGTPNGCFGRNNEYGSSAYGDEFRQKYGEVNIADDGTITQVSYAKTANSANDTSFVVNVWDLEQECVNSICYGAGYDRVLSFKDTVLYTITRNLSGVSIDNSVTSIAEGESYTANLTVSNDYTLREVVVTMGGIDVTDSVYSDGVINISEVTGNIVITATATAPAVNLVTTSLALDKDEVYNNGLGYKNGYYISTSGGGDSADSNCVTTGLIEYPISDNMIPNTLYVKGITLDTTSHTRCAIYTEDKTYKTCMGNGGIFNPSYFTVTELGEKYYKLEPVMHDEDTTYIYHAVMGSGTDGYTSVKYIRCSFDNNVGENLFISTEPIE